MTLFIRIHNTVRLLSLAMLTRHRLSVEVAAHIVEELRSICGHVSCGFWLAEKGLRIEHAHRRCVGGVSEGSPPLVGVRQAVAGVRHGAASGQVPVAELLDSCRVGAIGQIQLRHQQCHTCPTISLCTEKQLFEHER